MKRLLLWCLVFSSVTVLAESGGDALLDQLGEKPAQPAATEAGETTPRRFQAQGDVFQQQLAIQVQYHSKLSFDIKNWAQMIADNEFAKAAHLWTAIQNQVPGNFRFEAEASQLYLLWKLGLAQTFFDEWIKSLANSEYALSTPEQTLEALVTPQLDSWLLSESIVVTAKDQAILDRITEKKAFIPTLKGWASVRHARAAEEILPSMAAKNKITRFVASTVVYNHIKNGDIKGAARVLRNSYEPAIEASHDVELMANHDLGIARILYQAGQMKAAAQFYSKIPNQSEAYLPAQEELAWIYLRTGDNVNLRGDLKGLSSPLFRDRFQPETYLLRAISNLKMCFYDQLDKDFVDFMHSNSVWAKKIDLALNAKSAPAPANPDEYTKLSERAVQKREAELNQVIELGRLSNGAVLPAVGPQKHWKDYRGSLQSVVEEAHKRRGDEYTRQWKSLRSELQEAIRKMRFVKVEYESQVRQFSAESGGAMDQKKLVASNGSSLPASAVVKKSDSDSLEFPATSEVWTDELFKLRSAAQARCLKKGQNQ